MDTSALEISFDSRGICNFCDDGEKILESLQVRLQQEPERWAATAQHIRTNRKGAYDCLVGLSGGVDSSYVALMAHKAGLNPLCVHFDNGWNSATATSNINKIIQKTGFDLETYVIDWHEFKDLQRSFLLAGVIDIEMLTDHAIWATIHNLCRQHSLKFILSGCNLATEHGMPQSWVWYKRDLQNIKSIHRRFGTVPLQRYPTLDVWKMGYYNITGRGPRVIDCLDMIPYEKYRAMQELRNEFDWQYYGGKHYESIFTKFYQAHILPVKFGIDKRRVHLSSLIRTGSIMRDAALSDLESPIYDPSELVIDSKYVFKKLGFSATEFEEILAATPVPHWHYGTGMDSYITWRNRIAKILRRSPAPSPWWRSI